MPKRGILWLAVTADVYELPIYIEDTARELANKLGVSLGTVSASVGRNNDGSLTGRKIVKVDLNEKIT